MNQNAQKLTLLRERQGNSLRAGKGIRTPDIMLGKHTFYH